MKVQSIFFLILFIGPFYSFSFPSKNSFYGSLGLSQHSNFSLLGRDSLSPKINKDMGYSLSLGYHVPDFDSALELQYKILSSRLKNTYAGTSLKLSSIHLKLINDWPDVIRHKLRFYTGLGFGMTQVKLKGESDSSFSTLGTIGFSYSLRKNISLQLAWGFETIWGDTTHGSNQLNSLSLSLWEFKTTYYF